MKLGQAIGPASRELIILKQRVANAVEMRKKTACIVLGLKAEDQVKIRLADECGLVTMKGPEGQVDILALKVEKNSIRFPLKTIGVEVLNFPMSRHAFQVKASKLEQENGPFYVVVVETDLGKYSYLVYTYSEMRQQVQDKKLWPDGYYYFSVPRKALKDDKKYVNCLEKWEKISDFD